MKILVNGASISAKPIAWPNQLKNKMECEIINISCPGTGYTYVHESTVEKLSKEKFDLVLVMWPETMVRADWQVGSIDQFDNNYWTSNHLKGIHEGMPQDNHVPENWISSQGYLVESFGKKKKSKEELDTISRLFVDYFSVVKYAELVQQSLIRVVSLQGVLKEMKIPYLFMTPGTLKKFDRYKNLYQLIDWSQFYTEQHLIDLATERGWTDPDNVNYPNEWAYTVYAEFLYTEIKSRGYV
jgi:hypothetical protein